jgi:hypothetical protein
MKLWLWNKQCSRDSVTGGLVPVSPFHIVSASRGYSLNIQTTVSVSTARLCCTKMSAAITSRLPDVIKTLKILKNVVALAPLGEQVGAGIELAISICEMAEVRVSFLFH